MKSILRIVIASSLVAVASGAMASSSGGRPASALSALMSVFGVQDPTAPVAAGQPNQDCANFPSTPGHSVTAKGSAFNPSGKAGTVYAGEQPQNSKNPASVAQYDVACSKQPVK